jgi:NAD(P)-dependent dehydrogenase (short-subunit alcohol dehydrogenase family)
MSSQVEYNFTDKVALVTGGSSGIGRATALAFGEAGARVAVFDVNSDGGSQTVRMIEERGGDALFIQCDVSSEKEAKQAFATMEEYYGKLDFAFNNAGIEGVSIDFADCNEDDWDKILAVNAKGVWHCMKHELQIMTEQSSGAIVNCSSIAGLVGFPKSSAYVASKHAVLGLTKTAALEYARQNIRVNAICPGVIQTAMIDRYTNGNKDTEKTLLSGVPVGRMGTADEIAQSVLWLCSDGASYVYGHALVVDGAWTVQ